jgi:hypothetical protein
MKTFGALLAGLGALIQLVLFGGIYAIGEMASAEGSTEGAFLSGVGAMGSGMAIFIIILAGFALFSAGRFAGVLLMVVSVIAFFVGGGIFMALPFIGGLMAFAGGGSRVTMGGNYS